MAMTWAAIIRPIDANLRLEHKEIWGTAERMDYSQKGWCTRTEESKLSFMKGVTKDLCWMNDRARGKALLLVEEMIYSHAIEADSNNVAFRQWNDLQEHRKRLDDLRNLLRQETVRVDTKRNQTEHSQRSCGKGQNDEGGTAE